MNREEFEKLREKKKKRLGFIKISVWGVCYFCGAISLGYFIYGEKGIMPLTEKDVHSQSVKTAFAVNENRTEGFEIAAPTVTPTPETEGNTRNEVDSRVITK